ncbi:class I SAM-dependent methyltransferase [Microcoleus sp. FACHB-SPT15]|uniref:class I SAM-dependent methyltransferase n=1 Tax=Microcoleus sp. FACHB-SPT15 TaxID=2692830 RepID=UPI00177BBE8C|nr:class I SAM-dependent methyltransferase [Microcoleus sp. FACHB-SPT15]MBD1805026.1 class I SAM-dependent methyltransferase [Microcoleus sp. FACHB-SPT15]
MNSASELNSKIRAILRGIYYRVKNVREKEFECPICSYHGPFNDFFPATGLRKYAICFRCGSMERHRLQKLVLDKILKQNNNLTSRIMHFAPESFFKDYFKHIFRDYLTADLYMNNVDFKCDITSLPFKNEEFDLVFASHVLEHIKDDLKAISEIKRVLKPGGIAILPVPIVCKNTVEYSEPNPLETFHVRAPGEDYYERYSQVFSRVELFSSKDFPEKYQTFIYEDRSIYPNEAFPMRQPCLGEKHIDIVPVCFV